MLELPRPVTYSVRKKVDVSALSKAGFVQTLG